MVLVMRMGLAEIRKRIELAGLKEKKKYKKMLADLENVLRKIEEAVRATEEFEKKWGWSIEYKESNLEKLIIPIRKRPSLLDRITGRYYSDLALEILSISDREKISLISIGDLTLKVKERFPYATSEDVLKAIELLKRKGLITDIFKEDGIVYVEFPIIFEDIRRLVQLFKQEEKKFITLEEAAEKLNWSLIKAYRVLEKMVELGILVREDYPQRYWLIRRED